MGLRWGADTILPQLRLPKLLRDTFMSLSDFIASCIPRMSILLRLGVSLSHTHADEDASRRAPTFHRRTLLDAAARFSFTFLGEKSSSKSRHASIFHEYLTGSK